jgi:methionyl-tRNA formyltransferase
LDDGIDSGDVLLQRHFSVSPDETARTLYDKHVSNIAQMVPEAVRLVRSGTPPRLPQDHAKATYCAKRTREDGLIDWQQPAATILRLIRAAGDPYPGAFTYFDDQAVTIVDAISGPQPSRYIGLAGQVQAIEDGHFVVRCGDSNCIVVTRWQGTSSSSPRLHGKFRNFPASNTKQAGS